LLTWDFTRTAQVVRVHDLAPRAAWSKRYDLINDFEKMLAQNGTRILKFYLHISAEEQLKRFKQRLDDKSRHCEISESDYLERELWPQPRPSASVASWEPRRLLWCTPFSKFT
jgi:polyphosphate kinase 2 (PPK2 family)